MIVTNFGIKSQMLSLGWALILVFDWFASVRDGLGKRNLFQVRLHMFDLLVVSVVCCAVVDEFAHSRRILSPGLAKRDWNRKQNSCRSDSSTGG